MEELESVNRIEGKQDPSTALMMWMRLLLYYGSIVYGRESKQYIIVFVHKDHATHHTYLMSDFWTTLVLIVHSTSRSCFGYF